MGLKENYSFVYFDFHLFKQQTRRLNVLNRRVGSITRVKSALHFLMSPVLFVYYCFKIFYLCHILKGSVEYLYAKILSCIQMTRQHLLSFLGVSC
jgi:hypothetical protein